MDKKVIEKVLFIRRFEEKIIEIYHTDVIKSPVHLSIGQELFSVLLAKHIKKGDKIVGNYRSHALSLALTKNPQSISDELFAKSSGEFGGRGGSMHLGCSEMGMPWTSAIVASGIPVAVGLAEGQKRLNKIDNKKRIVICQFGDGAMEEGVFTESINYASLKQLPILFACEDNELAIHSFQNARTPNTSYKKRMESYGLKTSSYSYKKPHELSKGIDKAINEVRKGIPHFLIVNCYRWMEHVGVGYDWNLGYRDKKELDNWRMFDLETNPNLWGIDKECLNSLNELVTEQVNEIFDKSYKKENALNSSLLENIY
tara:strand:+ start:138 stop:1079 length:942 start_codon:yes stop_codon:yes gene_type:complete